jgi:hypothetical protein
MTEVTYYPQIECVVTVPDGMANTQVIYVQDEEKNKHFLRVAKGSLTKENSKEYLRVGIINVDQMRERALVELPIEADSGYRRIWVSLDNFRQADS